MGKPFDLKPKSGDYFTGEDVYPRILPTIPPKQSEVLTSNGPIDRNAPVPFNKRRQELWQKQISRIASGNNSSLGTPISRPNTSSNPVIQNLYKPSPPPSERKENSNKNGIELLPPYLRFFLSSTLTRAQGNPSSVWTVKVTTEKDGKVERKFQEFHLIVCWYQYMIGALGGIAVGVETKFFSSSRFSEPNVPFPKTFQLLRSLTEIAIQKSSSIFRLCKRGIISGYLFDVIDKNVEEHRGEKQDWKNMGIAGVVSGAIFGLRGGFRSTVAGSLLFGSFASLAGYQYYRMKKSKPRK